MARPRKGEEIKAGEFVGARLSADMRQHLEALAEANGRTLTAEVRVAIEAHVTKAARAAARGRARA